ncbi:pancreatic lipase-related protein 2-like isoform X2 [Montipora capricornis]|uniref:pancreatic lipase-related protein 2-like isoform X2 n=1 Tax=Montipora capricornis TaxID=246305 RepID=UPI0035F1B32B
MKEEVSVDTMKKSWLLVLFGCLLAIGHSTAFRKVCYGKYGCFSHAPPFINLLMALPQAPDDVNTTFSLYTRANAKQAQLVDDSDVEKIKKSNLDVSKRTIIICHGWSDNGRGVANENWGYRMRDALLDREDCNIILVDWSGGAFESYGQSAGNARLVGAQIAELIKFIIGKNGGLKYLSDQFYLIGFSLGAQITGYAGRRLREVGMDLGRITGLDPASPFYSYANVDVRLDPTDAKFVDVIHTDMPLYGTPQSVGHIDFFPNGGADQPGCNSGIFEILAGNRSCDHHRAPEYYIASVQNFCSWKSYPCHNSVLYRLGRCKTCNGECPTLGYAADQAKKTGSHYLTTNSERPFCGQSPPKGLFNW